MTAPVDRLGPLLVLTDRRQAARPLTEVVRAAVEGGARAIVVREKDLPRDERRDLVAAISAAIGRDATVLVASDGGLGGDGVHLAAADPPEPGAALVGRSCHDASEVDAAAAEGATYATVSPVGVSTSKPGYGPPLGIAGLAALCGRGVPVYALGGVDDGLVGACRGAGAAGVAVMGHLMRAADPAAATRALLRAWEAA